MLSRAHYCWPGSNYPVTLHDCSAGPPPSVASAAEGWRHRFQSRGRRGPPSCRGCARCRASAHLCRGLPCPSWASPPGHMPRIDFGALVEKRPLKKTLVHFHFAVTKTPHFEMAILHDDADLVYILCASHVYNNNIKLEIVWSFVEWLAHSPRQSESESRICHISQNRSLRMAVNQAIGH